MDVQGFFDKIADGQLLERLLRHKSLGETDILELKAAIDPLPEHQDEADELLQNIRKAICAFANSPSGGALVVGVFEGAPHQKVSSVSDHLLRTRDRVLDLGRQLKPPPTVIYRETRFGSRDIALFVVSPGRCSDPDGRFWYRKAGDCGEVTQDPALAPTHPKDFDTLWEWLCQQPAVLDVPLRGPWPSQYVARWDGDGVVEVLPEDNVVVRGPWDAVQDWLHSRVSRQWRLRWVQADLSVVPVGGPFIEPEFRLFEGMWADPNDLGQVVRLHGRRVGLVLANATAPLTSWIERCVSIFSCATILVHTSDEELELTSYRYARVEESEEGRDERVLGEAHHRKSRLEFIAYDAKRVSRVLQRHARRLGREPDDQLALELERVLEPMARRGTTALPLSEVAEDWRVGELPFQLVDGELRWRQDQGFGHLYKQLVAGRVLASRTGQPTWSPAHKPTEEP
jgi:hypothetical protein